MKRNGTQEICRRSFSGGRPSRFPQNAPLFLKRDGGPGGKGKTFFHVEKKFSPSPRNHRPLSGTERLKILRRPAGPCFGGERDWRIYRLSLPAAPRLVRRLVRQLVRHSLGEGGRASRSYTGADVSAFHEEKKFFPSPGTTDPYREQRGKKTGDAASAFPRMFRDIRNAPAPGKKTLLTILLGVSVKE